MWKCALTTLPLAVHVCLYRIECVYVCVTTLCACVCVSFFVWGNLVGWGRGGVDGMGLWQGPQERMVGARVTSFAG